MTSVNRHFVYVCSPMWGHIRPMISSAVSLLVQEPDLHATFLVQPAMLANLKKEVQAHGEHVPVERLTFIACQVDWLGFDAQSLLDDAKPGKGSPKEVLTVILKQTSGKVWDKGQHTFVELCAIKPSLFVIDMFSLPMSSLLLRVAQDEGVDISNIPRLIAFPSSAASLVQHFAGSPHGARHALIYNEALATVEAANPGLIVGKSEAEIWTNDAFNTELTRLFVHSIGDRFDSPGLAPGYDYEHFPQMANVPIPPAGPLFVALSGKLFLENMTGVIFPWSSDVLEKGAIEHAQLLFPTKDLFAIGVQGPDDLWEGKSVVASTQDRDPALQFLDKVLETKGEKQAMYISFGTVFFPALRPDLIAHLFETLLALERPFVFALASPLASLSEELLATFKASGLGYIAPFVPQIELLRHPAVGGFLSHGGSNSTSEALISKIPTVFWPGLGDQPLLAAWLTHEGLGYELLQVRTGPHNSRPTARGVDIVATPEAVVAEMTAVFTKLFGPEGDVVRRKVDEVSEALKADRREGEARKQMGRLGAVGKVRA